MKKTYIFPKSKIPRILAAIDTLLRWYRFEPGFKLGNDCPLCKMGCYTCPWKIIDRTWCTRYSVRKFGDDPVTLRRTRPKWWVADSIPRLKRWKKILEEAKR